ncbi:hypothetical protein DFH06DRAFT_1295087 [Mycena polygramma]|nr:hypothetical protein DFH06DRAFT_1295087 [Mycena polygramma]
MDRQIPRHRGRFCRASVEDEVHALLDCDAHAPLADLRECFLKDAFVCDPALEGEYARLAHYDFLRRMVSSRKAIQRFAKYVADVFLLFDSFERTRLFLIGTSRLYILLLLLRARARTAIGGGDSQAILSVLFGKRELSLELIRMWQTPTASIAQFIQQVCTWSLPPFALLNMRLSCLTEDQIKNLKETDHTFPAEFRRRAEDILVEKKAQYQVQLFSGVSHGFATQGDSEQPDNRYAKEESARGIVGWFTRFTA